MNSIIYQFNNWVLTLGCPLFLFLLVEQQAAEFNERMLRWFLARTVLLPRCWRNTRRKFIIGWSSWADDNYALAQLICINLSFAFISAIYFVASELLLWFTYRVIWLVLDFNGTVSYIFSAYTIIRLLKLGSYFLLNFFLFDLGIYGLRQLERSRSPLNIGEYPPLAYNFIRRKRRTYRKR
jgi:hypothetical protein